MADYTTEDLMEDGLRVHHVRYTLKDGHFDAFTEVNVGYVDIYDWDTLQQIKWEIEGTLDQAIAIALNIGLKTVRAEQEAKIQALIGKRVWVPECLIGLRLQTRAGTVQNIDEDNLAVVQLDMPALNTDLTHGPLDEECNPVCISPNALVLESDAQRAAMAEHGIFG
jgi:hypothetical protein